jgi:hypothetical protein
MTMEPSQQPQPPLRETMLTVVLTGLGAGAFLLFLIVISGGFFFYVVLAVAAMVGLGYFHYMVWGYAMTQEVAEEQAQAQRHLALLEEPWKDSIQRKP